MNNRTYGLPALLSFFFPGLGQLIKGQIFRGMGFFVGVCIGLLFLILPGIIIWIVCIADAYNYNIEAQEETEQEK